MRGAGSAGPSGPLPGVNGPGVNAEPALTQAGGTAVWVASGTRPQQHCHSLPSGAPWSPAAVSICPIKMEHSERPPTPEAGSRVGPLYKHEYLCPGLLQDGLAGRPCLPGRTRHPWSRSELKAAQQPGETVKGQLAVPSAAPGGRTGSVCHKPSCLPPYQSRVPSP